MLVLKFWWVSKDGGGKRAAEDGRRYVALTTVCVYSWVGLRQIKVLGSDEN